MKYKAAIFDFDGVLNDTESIKFQAWQKIAKKYKKTIAKQFFIDHCCGKSGEAIGKILNETYHIPLEPKEFADLMKQISKPMLLSDICPINANIQFLKKVHRLFNGNIALATSQDKEILIPSLEKLKILSYFKEIVAGHEIKHMKPAPDVYLKACKKLKVSSKSCVVIEDSQVGVESAYAAGIGLIVAIPGEFTMPQDFSKAHIIIGKKVKGKKHITAIRNLFEIL